MDTTFNHYRLEQLAHLGLPNQLFIPALLQELHHEIPSVSNSFFWIDETFAISNIYDELNHNTIVDNIIELQSSAENKQGGNTLFNNLKEPKTTLQLVNQCQFSERMFSEVFHLHGYSNTCFVPVKNHDSNSLLGVIALHRTTSDFDFNKNEKQQLEEISSIISNVWFRPARTDIKTTDGWYQGLLIVNEKGHIIEACAMGLKLLALASSDQFNLCWDNTLDNICLFDGAKELMQNLHRSDGPRTALIDPTFEVKNEWGQFKIKSYLVKNKKDEHKTKICFNIYWQEPLVLKLFHKIKKLGLTPRQETVGLLYASGHPLQIIADKLGLSIFTIKEHIKNISTRVDMKSRADLIELLLCEL